MGQLTLNGETRVTGLIGDPVAHTRSPAATCAVTGPRDGALEAHQLRERDDIHAVVFGIGHGVERADVATARGVLLWKYRRRDPHLVEVRVGRK